MSNGLNVALPALGTSMLLGNKLGGLLGDRFGMRRVVRAALAGQAALIVAFFVTSEPLRPIVAAVLVWGVFSWIPSPIINLAVVQAAFEATDVMPSFNNSTTRFAYAVGAGVRGIVVASAGAHPLCRVDRAARASCCSWSLRHKTSRGRALAASVAQEA